MPRLLLVDDEINFLTATADILSHHGYDVVTADSLDVARSKLHAEKFDYLLVDLMRPDGNGLELLELDHSKRPDRVVLMTGQPGIKNVIRDLHGPGLAYLIKPFDIGDLLGILKDSPSVAEESGDGTGTDSKGSATSRSSTAGSATSEKTTTESSSEGSRLLGTSDAMLAVQQKIEQVAAMDTTVLIRGESGTGKELVAQAIHAASGRTGQLVPVNCGAFPGELLGSQLFGHEKGAFTGANRRHVGVFERAAEGTLFLDEIAEMPIEQQPHLLRALETNRITRVGAEEEIPISCRVIAAGNRDFGEAISEGRLREDLYFRLSIYPIELPPLRQRREDIPLLAQAFLDDLNAQYDTRKSLSQTSEQHLTAWHWPGNVRELKHVIHRYYIDCVDAAGEITIPEKFSVDISTQDKSSIRPGRPISEVERELIELTLEHCDGNKPEAAQMLGISLKTLYNRLSSYESDDA